MHRRSTLVSRRQTWRRASTCQGDSRSEEIERMMHGVELGSRARLSAHTIRDHLIAPPCVSRDGDVPWDADGCHTSLADRPSCVPSMLKGLK